MPSRACMASATPAASSSATLPRERSAKASASVRACVTISSTPAGPRPRTSGSRSQLAASSAASVTVMSETVGGSTLCAMSTTAPVLPATLRLGPAHLTVTDLDRSVGFYQDAIGLRQQSRDDGVAALGTGGEDLLVLHEDPQARPAGRPPRLLHLALVHPPP